MVDKDEQNNTPRNGHLGNEFQTDDDLSPEEIAELQRMRLEYLKVPYERRAEEEEPAPVLWLITFTDIMALMLTFFVLLYSMSQPKVEEWSNLTTGLNKSFSKFYSQKFEAGAQDTINIERTDFSQALSLSYLESLLEKTIAEDDRLKGTVLIPQKNRLIVSLPQNLLFEAGQAEVNVAGKKAIFSIGDILIRIRNRIQVIGHTDPVPIQNDSAEFQSNWHLSLARAAEVARILTNVGYTKPVIVRGLSSARYEELPSELSEEERLGYARRVDIVILKDDGSQRLFVDSSL